MKLLLFIFVACAVTVVCFGQDNFEDDAAPPPSSSLLARAKGRALPGKSLGGAKSNVLDSKLKKAAPPTSPPPPQIEEDFKEEILEGEEDEGFVDENVEASSVKPTEAPKKLGQSARPFRSNQDLLETLKRRRENRVYVPPPSTTTSFTPVQIPDKQTKAGRSKYATSKGNFSPSQEQVFDNSKKSSNSRSFKNKATQQPLPAEEDLESTPAPKQSGRAFGGRSRRL